MSLYSHSRSSSLFSTPSSTASSNTDISTITKSFSDSLLASSSGAGAGSLLKYKPPVFSTLFASTRTTHLRFTAFPPTNLPRPDYDNLCFKTALYLLHNTQNASAISCLATSQSILRPIYNLPFPSNLSADLVNHLRTHDWNYYSLTSPLPVQFPVGSFTTPQSQPYHLAVRLHPNGAEHYLFTPGPLNLIIHTSISISDFTRTMTNIPSPSSPPTPASLSEAPSEPLYLVEKTEVQCSKALKWRYQSLLSRRTEASHELMRMEWDKAVRSSCKVANRSELLCNVDEDDDDNDRRDIDDEEDGYEGREESQDLQLTIEKELAWWVLPR